MSDLEIELEYGRERRDSGCQTSTMRTVWCRCPLTATAAATHAHARQEA